MVGSGRVLSKTGQPLPARRAVPHTNALLCWTPRFACIFTADAGIELIRGHCGPAGERRVGVGDELYEAGAAVVIFAAEELLQALSERGVDLRHGVRAERADGVDGVVRAVLSDGSTVGGERPRASWRRTNAGSHVAQPG